MHFGDDVERTRQPARDARSAELSEERPRGNRRGSNQSERSGPECDRRRSATCDVDGTVPSVVYGRSRPVAGSPPPCTPARHVSWSVPRV